MPKIIYKRIICKNPDCPVGEFIPTRSDKIYCDNICKSHHHRMLNSKEELIKLKENKELKQIDKALEKMHLACKKYGIQYLTEQELKLAGISFNRAVLIKTDPRTQNIFYFYYVFGIVKIQKEKNQYTIVKKSDYEI